jgi:hypothetical protein
VGVTLTLLNATLAYQASATSQRVEQRMTTWEARLVERDALIVRLRTEVYRLTLDVERLRRAATASESEARP